MSLLTRIDDDSNQSTPVRDIGCFTKADRKRLQLRRFRKDTYQTIDQDDESFFSNAEDDEEVDAMGGVEAVTTNRKMSTVSGLVERQECLNLGAAVSGPTLPSGGYNALASPTDRLVEAIEALRYSILDNTQLQSRSHQRCRTHRRRTSTYTGAKSSGSQQPSTRDIPMLSGDESLKIRKDKVPVELRIVFLKIGEIDTLKELYHADAFIQAKWREPKLDGLTSEQLTTVDLDKYWSPLLYIDNILTETKEAQWLTAVADEQLHETTVVERRRIKGVFLETLELNDFPLDVQDLTITMTTERPDSEIDLIPDQAEMSAINVQTFVDQQCEWLFNELWYDYILYLLHPIFIQLQLKEWKLHEHVEITKRIVLQEYSSTMKSHPCLSVTCRAARRPGYFYWNVFLIMFMISGLSFATFSVSPEKAEYRLRLSFTLVLTSVTFKYVITQSLPKISYLTYMDKYVLMSLAILCIVSIWHACVTLFPQSHILNNFNSTIATSTAKNVRPKLYELPVQVISNHSIFNKEFRRKIEKRSRFLRAVLQTMDLEDASRPAASYEYQHSTMDHDENTDEDGEDEDGNKRLNQDEIKFLKNIERDVLISFGSLYILAHLVFIFWLYFDASKRRRLMRQKDKDYRKKRELQQQRQRKPHMVHQSSTATSGSVATLAHDLAAAAGAGDVHHLHAHNLRMAPRHAGQTGAPTVASSTVATSTSPAPGDCIVLERSKMSRSTRKGHSEDATTFAMHFR